MSPHLRAVADVLEEGRREGVAPALSAVVLRGGVVVHASCHGTSPPASPPSPPLHADARRGGRSGGNSLPETGRSAPQGTRPLLKDDLFDVASLTKVMATTTLAAQLVEERVLELDRPVAEHLPGFGANGKERVTARHLLAHSSGIVRWRPYFEAVARDPVASALFLAPGARPPFAALRVAFRRGRELVRAAVLAEPLEAPPGTRAVYGDPGFLALGFLLEELLGEPLSRALERRVLRPLGLGATFFLDGLDPENGWRRAEVRAFVPTEACDHRHEVNQGTVNDDNAWAMGGAAGHAGLFSTAQEVASLGQAWLDALLGRRSVVPPAAAAFARRDATPGTTRALGWDTPSAEGSSLGTRLGRGEKGAIGHLGFTGTSLWIDVDAELVAALLTNRVHPSRDNERIRAFRPRFHDVVAEALGIG